jgi:GTP-binding protein
MRLGVAEIKTISAAHQLGVREMIDGVLAPFPVDEHDADDENGGIRIAVVGRPNVGKSTLVNRILGEERVVAFDQPGTTRDSIFIPFIRDDEPYTLIDTAGVRRRSRVTEAIEKFSIIKTLQAITAAHVVILVLDAQKEISEQDARLLGMVLESGRALVIAINKWDGMAGDERERIRSELDRKFSFISFAQCHYISALHGSGVGDLFGSIRSAYESSMRNLSTPNLTRLLQAAVEQHAPPLVRGRRIKLRYAHQGGNNPPLIVIHGNQVSNVPADYSRYLENYFRKHLQLEGTPVRIEFKSGDNPFKGRKNVLTKRQVDKRKRLKRFVKRGK